MSQSLFRALCLAAGLFGAPGLAVAELSLPEATAPDAAAATRVAALADILMMDRTFDVMVQEGMAYGASIEEQMFPGQGGARWSAMVATIYDARTLRTLFDTALQDALASDPVTVAAAEDFFGAPRGQEILKLEIEARRALLDDAVSEAAEVEAERMQAERDPRMALIRDLVEAGDLIETNVAGALTANLAFFQGMASVGAPGMALDDEQMMTEVWSQESSIRTETTKWLYPFLALAYQPLSDEDLKAYVAFSESADGQRLNAALFVAFDRVFRHVSTELGRNAALVMQGNDI